MSDWVKLATYNAERCRGLVHTSEYVEAMVREQARFDEWVKTAPLQPRPWWQWRRR
jgi:hypothetical protein